METSAVQGGLHAITGGLGGLGLRAAAMLIANDATVVALSSRSGHMGREVLDAQPTPLGAAALLVACDVG
ncbi:MAG: KR domain-containing protein, partial [Bacteroidota bacterium]|nr:KR domain-containing protein [Bacteroidota bacterium]